MDAGRISLDTKSFVAIHCITMIAVYLECNFGRPLLGTMLYNQKPDIKGNGLPTYYSINVVHKT